MGVVACNRRLRGNLRLAINSTRVEGAIVFLHHQTHTPRLLLLVYEYNCKEKNVPTRKQIRFLVLGVRFFKFFLLNVRRRVFLCCCNVCNFPISFSAWPPPDSSGKMPNANAHLLPWKRRDHVAVTARQQRTQQPNIPL